jgi:hypothetical protein
MYLRLGVLRTLRLLLAAPLRLGSSSVGLVALCLCRSARRLKLRCAGDGSSQLPFERPHRMLVPLALHLPLLSPR